MEFILGVLTIKLKEYKKLQYLRLMFEFWLSSLHTYANVLFNTGVMQKIVHCCVTLHVH